MDMEKYARSLYLSDVLRSATIRAVVDALGLPVGSQGLDIGSGGGTHTLLLAEAVAPDGHVTGLDISSKMVEYARNAADRSHMADLVNFRKGDMCALPFSQDTFDWCWSVDCVGYAPIEPLPLIEELVRVVRPGGLVSIMAWSSEQLLPGYPLLEARLRATTAGLLPFSSKLPPENHFLCTLGWFRKAGLQNPSVCTYIGEVQAPLTTDQREALIDLFSMRWSGVESELADEDWDQLQRLVDPGSPDFILDRPDYYAFFTYTQFRGTVA